MKGYCVRDKTMVDMINPQERMTKNGHPQMVGTCPRCGKSVYKFIKKGGMISGAGLYF
jgi:hypothetical protein